MCRDVYIGMECWRIQYRGIQTSGQKMHLEKVVLQWARAGKGQQSLGGGSCGISACWRIAAAA